MPRTPGFLKMVLYNFIFQFFSKLPDGLDSEACNTVKTEVSDNNFTVELQEDVFGPQIRMNNTSSV